MFSGVIEGLKIVKNVYAKKNFSRIGIDLGSFIKDVKKGDSISINGVCLTVASINKNMAFFDIVHETLKKTNLGDLKVKDKVNIERSLKIGDVLNGHFVLGHVDGKGVIEKKVIKSGNCIIWISLPNELQYGLIPKGSIAVDGISLTIVNIKKNKFSVALIPHTLKATTLGHKDKGDKVNIEIDYLGKWIKKLVYDINFHKIFK